MAAGPQKQGARWYGGLSGVHVLFGLFKAHGQVLRIAPEAAESVGEHLPLDLLMSSGFLQRLEISGR